MKRLRHLTVIFVLISIISAFLPAYFLKSNPVKASGFSKPEFLIYGQTVFHSGSTAMLRIVALQPVTNKPVPDTPVYVTLHTNKIKHLIHLYHGKTDNNGVVIAKLNFPSNVSGSAKLLVGGEDSSTTNEIPVEIQDRFRVFLSTDKPLYQPGQTMTMRVLSLNEMDRRPVSNTSIIFEVQDAKGNKVFKTEKRTSKFGIASSKFILAHEVNMGEYKVRAILDKGNNTNIIEEKSVTVKKYVLPKFKVSLSTAKPYYLAGEKVKGVVRAGYFFGKPVSGGNVKISISSFDTGFNKVTEINGKTNNDGEIDFNFNVPDYLVGLPLEKGGSFLKIEAQVIDKAEHLEKAAISLPVVRDLVNIELLPESGSLIPGLPNTVYLVASTPDGKGFSINATILHNKKHQNIKTDKNGIGEFTIIPATIQERTGTSKQNRYFGRRRADYNYSGNTETVKIIMDNVAGRQMKLDKNINLNWQNEGIILRTNKASYKVGDSVTVTVLATKKSGAVYLDLIQNGQTVLSRTVELNNNKGEILFNLPASSSGLLTLNGYELLESGEMVRDSKAIFVNPADDLSIKVNLNKSIYKPGEDATIDFQVSNRNGAPVPSALGVDIVDESLFALAEENPGLARVYFLIEKELLQPQYEIHGFSLSKTVIDELNNIRKDLPRKNDTIKKALFSKLPKQDPLSLSLNTFSKKLQVIAERYDKISSAIYQYTSKYHNYPAGIKELVIKNLLSQEDILDPWGNEFVFVGGGQNRLTDIDNVKSPGPDGKLGTSDDITPELLSKLYNKNRFRNVVGVDMIEEDRVDIMAGGPRVLMKALPQSSSKQDGSYAGKKESSVRVREYFPETLYTNPQVITDEFGFASISLPMADSITTWRLTAFASSLLGELGNSNVPIRVFQDFFVDIDLPVALTQGDIVDIPVAIYNYLPVDQYIKLNLEPASWFVQLNSSPLREIKIKKSEVNVVYFPIKVVGLGNHELQITARGSKMSDAIKRQIEVLPDGKELYVSKSDRLGLSGSKNMIVKTDIDIPEESVKGGSKILVTIYPGVLSQVIDGMDKLLRLPGGCFEQTSSSTYPNVLVLDYLKKINKITPEIRMKAESYINIGYQRLLTFEVPGGGFSVFGQAPANPVLTAYGLMEFYDMSKVYNVDPNLIARTKQWLLSKQGKDGLWNVIKEGFYAEGWGNRPNANLPFTAYIAWALAETGERGDGVKRAVNYIKEHLKEANDPYTLALVANALVSFNANDQSVEIAFKRLLELRNEDGNKVYWVSKLPTASYAGGKTGDIETTALALHALLRSNFYQAVVNKIMTYLVQSKDAYGTWHSTQSTILALRAMLLAISKAGEKAKGIGEVYINGVKAGNFNITPDNFEVVRQFDLGDATRQGKNIITLTFNGEGNLMYTATGKYYLPWPIVKKYDMGKEILTVDVKYDRTELHANDRLGVIVNAKNNTHKTANMVMLDLGIPPGFEVEAGELDLLAAKRMIQKYNITGRQIIVYLDKINAGGTVSLMYHLKAKYPIRAKTPVSRVYEYYNPAVEGVSVPQTIVVRNRSI